MERKRTLGAGRRLCTFTPKARLRCFAHTFDLVWVVYERLQAIIGIRIPLVDVYSSERRDAAAAEAFFRGALRETGVRPRRVTTDKAAAYPSALRVVLPAAEHVAGKAAQQGIERDHQHLKGRIRCMRGFKSAAGAAVFGRAHGFVRKLRDGFYRLGLVPGDPRLPQRPRLVLAWDELTAQVLAA